jgi:hypothetical protein
MKERERIGEETGASGPLQKYLPKDKGSDLL